MAYATVTDVENRLGRSLTDPETTMAETLLSDALLIIKDRVYNFDEKIADGDLPEEVVTMVQANMVTRALRNPEGIRQETDGDYSYTLARSPAAGEGLYLTAQESRLIGATGRAYSVMPNLQRRHAYPYPWDCGVWY